MSDAQTWSKEGYTYRMLQIHSSEATSLSLNFGKFTLADKAEMYVFNDEKNMLVGPITPKENNNTSKFAIAPLRGSGIIVLIKEN
ncbi:hypothetical protein [Pedobacter agri]|uniref:hypothetical protein n=1 Tax=Pedobacter agri TaxID=454586 RepID=UPI00292DC549|nr:hypothetical protein [Pedobacter agri]